MNRNALEGIALRAIERAKAGQQAEDDCIEFKRELSPDHHKMARRIAGHANSLRGAEAIWVIGVDEQGKVHGAASLEFADWWAQVKSHFIEVAPEPQMVSVMPPDDPSVIAIAFASDRCPYLVTNKNGGTIASETPWRTATATSTATRAQLLTLLLGTIDRPSIELIKASAVGNPKLISPVQNTVHLTLYVEPKGARVIFPFHRIRGAVRDEAQSATYLLQDENTRLQLENPEAKPQQRFATVSWFDAVLDGPAMLRLVTTFAAPKPANPDQVLSANITLEAEPGNQRIAFNLRLLPEFETANWTGGWFVTRLDTTS